MNITPIRTSSDYKAALKSISKLVEADPAPDSPEGEYLDVMATLIEAYEAKQFPIDAPDPIQAIKFRMEQAGLEPKDLAASIGKPNRVYEVLNGKRGLSIEMIRNLRKNLGIPAESLIGA
ncbi:helix-turn-helix domain-containing protein [Xanthomonas oryzae]|uniref:Transcriptional regulator n=1 Tax=Xanthomonas oryzae pv. leersiae TaxID=3112258 RepID=A0AAJ6GW80_9XANT|nr:helix-turn-helix domain-containing protein [Xanthomonas oryzae]WIX07579.1 transcriptional regulator [Xanthomonas oryzae pv. oryzae]